MRSGCDFSMARPPVSALQNAGLDFVLRYVSNEGNAKNLTRTEADRYRAVGLDIGVVFETTAGRALAGAAAGQADAHAAHAQVVAAGGPPNGVIYFAVDFDAMPDQLVAVSAYLTGAASVLGRARTGVYGSYRVVAYAFDQRLVGYGWQTYAWSSGRWDNRAQLRQVRNGVTLPGGHEVDMCEAHADDWGQWARQQGEDPMAIDADVKARFDALDKAVAALGPYLMSEHPDVPAHVGIGNVYDVVRRIEDRLAALDGGEPDGSALDIATRLTAIEQRLDGLTLRATPAVP